MAEQSGNSEDGFPIRLLVDEKKRKVVIAEAGKELVDFFFSLMQLPLGAAVSLLGKSVPGSIWELHDSIRKLNGSYFSAAPPTSSSDEVKFDPPSPPLPSPRNNRIRKLRVYICDHCKIYLSDAPGVTCLSCPYGTITREATFVLPSAVDGTADRRKEKGFVKEMGPFAITDDLSIAPLSAVDIFPLIKRLRVNEGAPLQARTVVVRVDQCMRILEMSLRSKTVLSDVFLSKRAKRTAV